MGSLRAGLPVLLVLAGGPPVLAAGDDALQTTHDIGRPGGRLVVALRTEPKTLNPVTAVDSASHDVLKRMSASLIEIQRDTQLTAPGLARSWRVSPDGRRYTLQLRRGVRFSDGHPFDADDVLFSFQAYLDERNGSPQRDLLIVGGKPIAVRKIDAYTVSLELAEPYAAAERLFDGIAMLPRHLLEKAQQAGTLAQAWGLGTPPSQIAGLGPFRLASYAPGTSLVLQRNPHYWKVDRAGQSLPYLQEAVFLLVPSEDAQVIRFKAGETDLIARLSAENYAALTRDARGYRMEDLGPGLEYSFLLFNLNDVDATHLAAVARRQAWFRDVGFRRAISAVVDRPGIVKLVHQGRATALGTPVTPGNKLWVHAGLATPPPPSLASARDHLVRAGFTWTADGGLVDGAGSPVEFSIITNAANAARVQTAVIVQEDLRQLGMRVNVVPLESRAVAQRVLQTHDYDVALMALGSGDVDPNGEINVWLSSGKTHLWHLGQAQPSTPWEAEIDRLMRRQLVTLDVAERKRQFDRVQELVAENLPLIPLVSPNILVGAKAGLGNFRPAILDHYVLWNADELYWVPSGVSSAP
jgi:peptide/nickel transport system substrate-binding protein